MKNLFFYGNVDISDQTSGISKKVNSQIEVIQNNGIDVFYTSYTPNGVAIMNKGEIVKEKKYDTNNKSFRYLRRWYLIQISIDFLSETNLNIELSYLRFHYFDRIYNKLLKTLKKNNTFTLIEVHSYPYRTFSNKLVITNIVDSIFENFAKKYIDAVVVIGNDKNIWGKDTINIDNAVNLNKVPMKKNPLSTTNQIKLVNVSSERKYHGLDKVILGVKSYYDNNGTYDLQVNFVGNNLESTKQLVKDLNLSDKIHFLGPKFGEDLYEVYNQSDLGIGGLGNRSNAEFASTIKTKEYFAIGIPFINGWKEYSFDDTYPYVKRLNTKNTNIDFFEVINFYEGIKNDLSVSNNMRKFAEEHFTFEAQWQKILKYLNEKELIK